MMEVGLVRTEVAGKALLCTWDSRNPAARKLADLLEASEHAPSAHPHESALYGSLRAWGAGLAREATASQPLPLEETLAYGVELARRDPDVAQVWPVVLAKHRGRIDLGRLEILVRRLGQKRALGFLLTLTGLLLTDPTLPAFARRLLDSRVRGTQDFFTIPRGSRMRALARENSPRLAKLWHFRMNTSLESFRHHFEKFTSEK